MASAAADRIPRQSQKYDLVRFKDPFLALAVPHPLSAALSPQRDAKVSEQQTSTTPPLKRTKRTTPPPGFTLSAHHPFGLTIFPASIVPPPPSPCKSRITTPSVL
eukprot:757316-Hanusia_phi.AAC.1